MAGAARWWAVLQVWPLPALCAWALAWWVFRLLLGQGASVTTGLAVATALGVAASLLGATWWRRLWIGVGFPLSVALSMPALGLAAVPAWAWLVPLGVLLLIYPINAWRDAPLFPTPRDALRALPQHARLPDGARILDAGCGTGAGLLALRRAYPAAELQGLERSWPLCLLAALRCPWARVRPGDMWRANWAAFDMVYLFQRPESMPRAVDKAAALRPGAWLVSLEFEALALQPTASYTAPGGQTVWLYRAPFQARVA